MTDQEFIHQLASDLSAFRPTVTWTLEPVWYRKNAGMRVSGYCYGGSHFCGGVIVLGRVLLVQMGADATNVLEHLSAKGYEIAEAFNNGTRVK